jgi:hypothetical protein
MARRLQPGLDLTMVVDLAVLDDVDAAVLVGQGLGATLEVDDRQAPRREADRAADDTAPAVRSTMDERRGHRRQGVPVHI